ncbi:nucleotide exchange factor GrpE [Luteimicrobium sp. DT211]|uniref:nucleotide exchange factor GrpE n=1 Tax=Luteimicrobium sp. DT211 TaxID=3393412 RepID=UPI003CF4FF57
MPEEEPSSGTPFHFTDKRRIDPETGQPREAASSGTTPDAAAPAGGEDSIDHLDFEAEQGADALAGVDSALAAAQAEAATHLDALQRERAEFVNYRNRAKRESEAARSRGVEDVLLALLPVLDDVERARAAGDLAGPFAAIADKLDGVLAKYGVERFGRVGEEFDPNLHHALMHQADADATSTTISIVIEPGYRIGEKVVRPANVAVVGPES